MNITKKHTFEKKQLFFLLNKMSTVETTEVKKRVIKNRVSKEDLERFKDYVKSTEAEALIKDQNKNKHVSILKLAFEQKIGKPISKSTVYKVLHPKD